MGGILTGRQAAEFLIGQAGPNHEPPLSVLHLNLLLYYAQGWHLASYEKPLFSDAVEAWPGGPAVQTVWEAMGGHGAHVIEPAVLEAYHGMTFGMDADAQTLMEMVWASYGATPVFDLRAQTLQEPPFLAARKGLDPKSDDHPAIPLEVMRTHFLQVRGGLLRTAEAGPVGDDADLQWLLSAAALHGSV